MGSQLSLQPCSVVWVTFVWFIFLPSWQFPSLSQTVRKETDRRRRELLSSGVPKRRAPSGSCGVLYFFSFLLFLIFNF